MVQWRKWITGVILLGASVAWAEESAEQWLQKMLVAGRQVSYQGHSVLLSGGQMTTLAIYHAPVDDDVWERVVHLSGEPAEILRKGATLVCLHPDSATRLDLRRTPLGKLSALEESAQSISRHYRFSRVANERVAGREGVRINVEPLDGHRYGYSLWLDPASGVLLKSQTAPVDGEPLEVFEFVDLRIGEPLPPELFSPAPGLPQPALSTPSARTPDTAAAPTWEPGWLPSGFRPAGLPAAAEHPSWTSAQVYTDGLAAFTVFFDRAGEQAASSTARIHGPTVAVHRVLPNAAGRVTVVGEIPLDTANRVADGVKILAAQP